MWTEKFAIWATREACFLYTLLYFDCAGSLLLCGVFSSCVQWALVSGSGLKTPYCNGFSCGWIQARADVGSTVGIPRLSCSVACGSSQTRDQTRVSCIVRQILHHRATRGVWRCIFLRGLKYILSLLHNFVYVFLFFSSLFQILSISLHI